MYTILKSITKNNSILISMIYDEYGSSLFNKDYRVRMWTYYLKYIQGLIQLHNTMIPDNIEQPDDNEPI